MTDVGVRVAPSRVGALTALVAGAAALTQGALLVAGVGFLGGLLVLVGIEEVLGSDPALGVASRATLLGILAVGASGAIGELLRVAAERTLRMRAALRLLREPDAPMPSAVERASLARGPVHPLRSLLGAVSGSAGFVALMMLWGGLSEESGELALVGVVSLAVAVAAGFGFWRVGTQRARWSNDLGRLRVAWPAFADSDLPIGVTMVQDPPSKGVPQPPRAKRRSSVSQRLLWGVTTVAVVVAFLGIFTRQQCRTCDPIAYDPAGERAVDGVATVGLALLALAAACWLARALVVWSIHVVRELAVLAQARTGSVERTAWIDRAFTQPRALELLARAAGTVTAVLAVAWLASGVSATSIDLDEAALAGVRPWGAVGPLVAFAAVASLALGALGVVATQRWRAVVQPRVDADPFAGFVIEPRRGARRRRAKRR